LINTNSQKRELLGPTLKSSTIFQVKLSDLSQVPTALLVFIVSVNRFESFVIEMDGKGLQAIKRTKW